MKKGEIRTKFFSNKLEFHKMFEICSDKQFQKRPNGNPGYHRREGDGTHLGPAISSSGQTKIFQNFNFFGQDPICGNSVISFSANQNEIVTLIYTCSWHQ